MLAVDTPFAPEEVLRIFYDAEVRADPYPLYERLRTYDPVHPSVLGVWLVSRYDDVARLLRSPQVGVEEQHIVLGPGGAAAAPAAPGPFDQLARLFTLFTDPPRHTRLRRLVSMAFTPSVIQRHRPRFQAYIDSVFDEALERGGMDVVTDLALPMSTTFICEMLGVPEADRMQFTSWARGLAARFDLGPLRDPVIDRAADRSALAFSGYFRGLANEHRAHPRDDLISDLLAVEDGGEHLSLDELIATCVLLVWAGHETTTSLMGNGTLSLLRNPDQLARLRDDPGLAKPAIEEMVRYESPVQVTMRAALDDLEVGGRHIPKGALMVLMLGAANRDPEHFPDPGRFDVARTGNTHLAFGHGMHYCLGSAMGRAEVQIAIGTMLRRLPRFELATDYPEWKETFVLRGLRSLPIEW